MFNYYYYYFFYCHFSVSEATAVCSYNLVLLGVLCGNLENRRSQKQILELVCYELAMLQTLKLFLFSPHRVTFLGMSGSFVCT